MVINLNFITGLFHYILELHHVQQNLCVFVQLWMVIFDDFVRVPILNIPQQLDDPPLIILVFSKLVF